MTIRTSRALSAGMLVCALALAGCSGGGDGGEASDGSGGSGAVAERTGTPSASGSRAGSGDPERNGAAAAGIDPASAPEPLGSVTVPVGSDKVESSLAELLELEARGRLLVGTFRVTPQGPGDDPVDAVAALGEFWTPELHDLTGLKRYTTVTDLRSNQWGVRAEPGTPMFLWVAWPMPQGATTVDVSVSSHGPTLEDVPLPAPSGSGGSSAPARTHERAEVSGDATDALLKRHTHAIRLPKAEPLTRASEAAGEQVLTLSSDILFGFDSATMPPTAGPQIAALVRGLPRGARVVVGGHTDSLGTDARNRTLSQERAASVGAAIRAARSDLVLTIRGHGSAQPVEDNEKAGKDNPEGRAKNRRVEIRYRGPVPTTPPSAGGVPSAGSASESPVTPGSPGIDLASPPKPLGSVTIPAPSKAVTSTVADLLQLRVKDGFVLGWFRLTPTATVDRPVDAVAALGEFWTPRLLDATSLTAYDTNLDLRSDQWGTKARSGKPMYLWAAWPLPAGAKTVDVQVSSLAPRIEDVPLP